MKITVVGSGFVGQTSAMRMLEKGLGDVVLIDIIEGKPQGLALDLKEAAPVEGYLPSILGTNDYADTAGSDIVVITAGFPRQPGMSRMDLLGKNADIMNSVISQVVPGSPEAIIIVVSNPLDEMTYLAAQSSGFPKERVFGMAGVLDSARLRYFIAEITGARPSDVDAMTLGSHGDAMIALPRHATVAGKPLPELVDDDDARAALPAHARRRRRDRGAAEERLGVLRAERVGRGDGRGDRARTRTRRCRSAPGRPASTASTTPTSACPRSSGARASRRSWSSTSTTTSSRRCGRRRRASARSARTSRSSEGWPSAVAGRRESTAVAGRWALARGDLAGTSVFRRRAHSGGPCRVVARTSRPTATVASTFHEAPEPSATAISERRRSCPRMPSVGIAEAGPLARLPARPHQQQHAARDAEHAATQHGERPRREAGLDEILDGGALFVGRVPRRIEVREDVVDDRGFEAALGGHGPRRRRSRRPRATRRSPRPRLRAGRSRRRREPGHRERRPRRAAQRRARAARRAGRCRSRWGRTRRRVRRATSGSTARAPRRPSAARRAPRAPKPAMRSRCAGLRGLRHRGELAHRGIVASHARGSKQPRRTRLRG